MEATPNPQSRLLALPSELRVQILRLLLAGWEIPIDAWTSSIDSTLAFRSRYADLRTIAVFHVNWQIRLEATPLINACATLCFLSGPRSAWDRRWCTAGRPLPDLIKLNVAYVMVDIHALRLHHVLPLQALPSLREVLFVSELGSVAGYGGVPFWDEKWPKFWKSEQELADVKARELKGEDVEVTFTVGWLERDDGPPGPLGFRFIHETMFRGIKLERKETRTIVCRCVQGGEESGTLRENKEADWVMTLKDRWQIQNGTNLLEETLLQDGSVS